VATSHAKDATVSNIYKVRISKYEEYLPVSNEETKREYIATVHLDEQ